MKKNSILLVIILFISLIIGLMIYNSNKKENYINYGEVCVEQKAQNSKYEKSQQLTPIGIIDQNNDNPLDYDICKKNVTNINDTACDVSINKDFNLSPGDCNKNAKCCKDATCSCEKYLNNFGNESLFSDVLYITGNSCANDTSAKKKCERLAETYGGRCVENHVTSNYYFYPKDYAIITDYPVKTVKQTLSFRPGGG